jgi:hypothetical protein
MEAALAIVTFDLAAALGLAILRGYSNEYERAILSLCIAGFLLSALIACGGFPLRSIAPS